MERQWAALVDSDAFVAWIMPDDLLHEQAKNLFGKFMQEKRQLVTTSNVISETATVLSYRGGQDLARAFLEKIGEIRFPVIHITESLYQETLDLYKQQSGRGISMVDCSNAVVMNRFDIPEILSFDKFYRRFKVKSAH